MQPQASPFISMLPLILIFVIFYFLLIRPQQKKQKEHEAMLKDLQKNDEIVTNGGIHGTIVNVKEQTVIVRIDDNVKIELDKSCVGFKKLKEGQPA
ncbi:MAG: preprotein translocase subunit YajC [Candidatus Omnitrophota bacterium]